MRKILLFASIVALFASCSSKPKFELEVNINNNESLIDKKFVVVQQVDGRTVFTDTMKIKKNNFLIKVPYEGPALLNISMPNSEIRDFMMAGEEGKIQLNIDGIKPHIGGTPLNDRLQAFYNGNDSVSLLFKESDNEYELIKNADTYDAERVEKFLQARTKLLKSNTDRIVAFIKENVDNPVGEYYFMTNYITFTPERRAELDSFATDKLKEEFKIQ